METALKKPKKVMGLRLENLGLSELPPELDANTFPLLKIFSAEYNKLTTLPDGIKDFDDLWQISFHHNMFETFPLALLDSKSSRLTSISFSNNV
jgi:hypothetical protein